MAVLPKGWKMKRAKVRGAFGETDYDKKVVKINKKRHEKGSMARNPDGTENLLTTILHEINHVRYPKKSEKGVEKLAVAMKSRMSDKQKAKYYAAAT